MNREQVIQILSTLKAAFPHSFQKMCRSDVEAMINLWLRQFANEDAKIMSAAVDSLIATRTVGYSPTVGEIKEQIHRLRVGEQPSEADAWALVERACRNGLYHSEEEFERLPPEVQRAVGSPEQLRAWAQMDSETVNSVIASNFRKSYAAAQERAKHAAALPANVREMLSAVSEHLIMEQSEAPVLMPAKLEPMKRAAIPIQLAQSKKVPTYHPPGPEEWEKRRSTALERMNSAALERQDPKKS